MRPSAELHEHVEQGKRLFWFEDASDAELDFLYSRAKGLVLASFAEGFGLPIVEGFAAGVPVLASDIPVFREVGAAAAVYAAPNDVTGWARALARIAGDDAERARLRQAGRARAAELTYDRTAAATLDVLREVAGGRR